MLLFGLMLTLVPFGASVPDGACIASESQGDVCSLLAQTNRPKEVAIRRPSCSAACSKTFVDKCVPRFLDALGADLAYAECRARIDSWSSNYDDAAEIELCMSKNCVPGCLDTVDMAAVPRGDLHSKNTSLQLGREAPVGVGLPTGSLVTLFAQNNGFRGNSFDLQAIGSCGLVVTGWRFGFTNPAGSTGTVSIYWRHGTANGFETTAVGWILLGTASVTTLGNNQETPVAISGLVLPAGQVIGIYYYSNTYPTPRVGYTNGGPTVYSNADLQLTTFRGIGASTPFGGGVFSFRQVNARVLYTILDSDGDGVCDGDDLCPGTMMPEETVPERSLGINRWALTLAGTDFQTQSPQGDGPQRAYSTTDTHGCSCEQIIASCKYGVGQTRFGCSVSVMDAWVADPTGGCHEE